VFSLPVGEIFTFPVKYRAQYKFTESFYSNPLTEINRRVIEVLTFAYRAVVQGHMPRCKLLTICARFGFTELSNRGTCHDVKLITGSTTCRHTGDLNPHVPAYAEPPPHCEHGGCWIHIELSLMPLQRMTRYRGRMPRYVNNVFG